MTEGAGLSGGSAPSALPELRQLPRLGEGYEPEKVEEVFDAFRRQIGALQAELYELKTHGGREPAPLPGEEVRAETLRLVQAGAELAQAIEQDAHETAARQLARLEEELAARMRQCEAAIEREHRQILDAAQAEARAQLAETERRVAEELAQAELRAEQILEQAHSQAAELRASANDEIERMDEQAHSAEEAAWAAPDQEPPVTSALSFWAPPLSPEDLAENGSAPFRLEPVPDD
jgi:hypothetical protein